MRKVEHFKFKDLQSGYALGDVFWRADTLVKAAKRQNCEVYRLPLEYMDLSHCRWEKENIFGIADTYMRIRGVNLKYPVIISPDGALIEGYHRVARAFAEGKRFVVAQRLNEMPPYDEKRADGEWVKV